jgi:hypothetical protein
MELDPLLTSTDNLEIALSGKHPGREAEWAAEVSCALESVAEGLQSHLAETEDPKHLIPVAEGKAKEPSPTQERRVQGLRQEIADCLQRVQDLQGMVRNALDVFQSDNGPLANRESNAIPDFGQIRVQGEQLIVAVAEYMLDETNVVLDAVTTDIGVGD